MGVLIPNYRDKEYFIYKIPMSKHPVNQPLLLYNLYQIYLDIILIRDIIDYKISSSNQCLFLSEDLTQHESK